MDILSKVLKENEKRYVERVKEDYKNEIDINIIDILYRLCIENKGRCIVEIGAEYSVIPLLLACNKNEGWLVFSSDKKNKVNEHGNVFVTYIKEVLKIPFEYIDNKWTYKFGIDSIEMGKEWNGGSIDFLYMNDLNDLNEYETIKEEIEAWWPHLNIDGWIVINYNDGESIIKKVVNELLTNRPQEFGYNSVTDYNIGILIKKK